MYARGEFVVNLALIDTEFGKISDRVPLAEVNTTAAREHIPKIERHIHTIKEHTRCTTCDFPFDPIPKMVSIHVIYTVCMWLNVIRPMSRVTGGLSPRDLVTGRIVDYRTDCRTNFGAYVQVSTDAMVTNDQTPHTYGCISLGPVGNC